MVVNPGVTGVTNLTTQQATDIWTGKTTNWSRVGGTTCRSSLMLRPASSGTRATFKEIVLGGENEAHGQALTEDSNGAVTRRHRRDTGLHQRHRLRVLPGQQGAGHGPAARRRRCHGGQHDQRHLQAPGRATCIEGRADGAHPGVPRLHAQPAVQATLIPACSTLREAPYPALSTVHWSGGTVPQGGLPLASGVPWPRLVRSHHTGDRHPGADRLAAPHHVDGGAAGHPAGRPAAGFMWCGTACSCSRCPAPFIAGTIGVMVVAGDHLDAHCRSASPCSWPRSRHVGTLDHAAGDGGLRRHPERRLGLARADGPGAVPAPELPRSLGFTLRLQLVRRIAGAVADDPADHHEHRLRRPDRGPARPAHRVAGAGHDALADDPPRAVPPADGRASPPASCWA